MRVPLIRVIPVTLSIFLSGCGTLGIGEPNYSCSNFRDGVNCKSAREVYDMTEHSRTPRAVNARTSSVEHATEATSESGREAARRRGRAVESEIALRAPTQEVRPGRHFELDGPTPIRTPAQVMRIWIDAYEDTKGDLHVPGLVYTEIQERTWTLGQRAPERANQRVRSISGQTR